MIKGQNLQIKDILVMSEICKICSQDFTSHSFNLVCNTLEGGHIFYTKISNASKYNDTNGIVSHCTNYLNYINPKKWSWIIDFEDFGIKHTLGINTGIQLSKLINTFGKLQYLLIINTNVFVEQMMKMIKISLNKEHHKCIHILHEKDELKQEMIEKWKSLDNSKHLLIELIT